MIRNIHKERFSARNPINAVSLLFYNTKNFCRLFSDELQNVGWWDGVRGDVMVVMMSSRMAVLLYLERGVVVLLAAVALLLAIVSFRGQPHTTSNHILALRVHLDSDLPKLLSYFVKRIFSCHFAASCAQSLADLSSYSSHISTFSLILKGFDFDRNCWVFLKRFPVLFGSELFFRIRYR